MQQVSPHRPTSIYSSKALGDASWTIRLVQRGLLLYLEQIVKLTLPITPEKGDFPTIGLPAKVSTPHWVNSIHLQFSSNWRRPRAMSLHDLTGFKTFFWDFEGLMQPGQLRQATRYFARASDLAGVESTNLDFRNLDSRFLDYITSLESVLGEVDEARQKLALRTAILAGGSPEERQDTFDFIKSAYKVRSEGVHGGTGMKDVMIRERRASPNLGILEDVDLLHYFCRLCLRRLVDLFSAIGKNPNATGKWNKLKRNEKDRWIRELLDYSLIRSDLADALEKFFNHELNIEALWAEYEKTRRYFGATHRILHLRAI